MKGSFYLFKNQCFRIGGYYENFKICFDRTLYSLHDSHPYHTPGLAAAIFAESNNNRFMDPSQFAFVDDLSFKGGLKSLHRTYFQFQVVFIVLMKHYL
jgi:hypothetical protein